MLSECGAVSGLDIILLRISSGKLSIYKSEFHLSPGQEEIIGDRQCGFDDMGELMTIYFGFLIYLWRFWGGRDYNEAVHRIQ